MSLAIGIMNRIDTENSTPSVTGCQGIGSSKYVMIAKNINADTFGNGVAIPLITDQAAWNAAGAAGTPARCFYNNDPANGDIYGQLYNLAAMTLAETTNDGWPGYLRSNGWRALRNGTGSTINPEMASFAGVPSASRGGRLKAKGTQYWSVPNTGATNATGFTGLPGGQRTDSVFESITTNAYFWCLRGGGETRAVSLDYNQESLDSIVAIPETYGLSVRVGRQCS
tara:strand:+ start:874 stop:1551 length:678 start_codon:yes stop_codon:yes gene_type:complete